MWITICISNFDHIKMYGHRQADTCRSPLGLMPCTIVHNVVNVYFILYIFMLEMLLTIVLLEPKLSPPSSYLLIWLQRHDCYARTTWRRLTSRHSPTNIPQKTHTKGFPHNSMLHTKFNRYRQFYFCYKSRKIQWQFKIFVCVCWIDPLVTYLINKTNEIFGLFAILLKIVQIQQSCASPEKKIQI